MAIVLLAAAGAAHGQSNALPPLAPPYGEIPPTFWEQHATFVVLAGLGFAALAGVFIWLVLRSRPEIIIPPEVQARVALEDLRQRPEDGVVLSRISQAVRNYFIAAFQLTPGEFTTTEFNCVISKREEVGVELAAAVIDFLRDCDARKFSAVNSSAPMNAANQALGLVDRAEQRRAQLRQRLETQNQDRHS